MSPDRFEELVDSVSYQLLTVDFGTLQSLVRTLQKLEALEQFLVVQDNNNCRTDATTHVLQALRCAIETGQPSLAQAEGLRAELEALTQYWYDQAKCWDHGGVNLETTSGRRPLVLSDVADTALLAEFIANARLKGDDLENQIDALRTGQAEATAELRRDIHTLKGEAGMLGIDELACLLHATESYLQTPVPVWERVQELLRVRDWMMDALRCYQLGYLSEKPANSLIERLNEAATRHGPEATSGMAAAEPAQVDVPKAPLPPANLPHTESPASESTTWDDQELELVVEFLHEGQEAIGTVDQTLLELEHDGPDAECINKLFRAFHSLKGVASFLRLSQIVELSHTTETMLSNVRSGKLTAGTGIVDLIFDATTLLRSLFDAVRTAMDQQTPLSKVSGVEDLVKRIEAATQGNVIPQGEMLQARPGARLGEILLANGAISETQLTTALDQQKDTGRRLGDELISKGAVPPKVVAQALRGQTTAVVQDTKTRDIVKVDLERVDSLVETIGELVIVESMVSNAPEMAALPPHLRNFLGQFAKITRELQELGMSMRMVPLRAEFQKMGRMVRDVTRRINKQVRLELHGESTEMDRSMVEQVADPLVHLIRNAVDHGIESPAERRALGKSETGTITLSAAHEAGSIVVEIADDGRGIDRERVLRKATSQGLVAEGTMLTDNQVYDLLFMPGFSTAAQVTEISGRGVGMDVVKRNIEAMRGRIVTTSAPGRGTTFRLVLPLTLAIIDGMVIRCGNEQFIVPTLSIIESLRPAREMLLSIAGRLDHILARGQCLPLLRLGQLLDISDAECDPAQALIVIVESMHEQVALLVDEVVMKHQVVIKTLRSDLEVNHLFAGAAILSNGRVGLILNIDSLVETTLAARRERARAVA